MWLSNREKWACGGSALLVALVFILSDCILTDPLFTHSNVLEAILDWFHLFVLRKPCSVLYSWDP